MPHIVSIFPLISRRVSVDIVAMIRASVSSAPNMYEGRALANWRDFKLGL